VGGIIHGRALVPGEAQGETLITDEPLSFWGGYDQHTGEIIDRRHPLSGEIAAGKVLVLPSTRGSSTTTAILLESVRLGTQPAAVLTRGTDSFLALASIVADELYQLPFPVIALSGDDFARLEHSRWLRIHRDGTIEIDPSIGSNEGPI
jgi:predicted aconitase with swiveling domain